MMMIPPRPRATIRAPSSCASTTGARQLMSIAVSSAGEIRLEERAHRRPRRVRDEQADLEVADRAPHGIEQFPVRPTEVDTGGHDVDRARRLAQLDRDRDQCRLVAVEDHEVDPHRRDLAAVLGAHSARAAGHQCARPVALGEPGGIDRRQFRRTVGHRRKVPAPVRFVRRPGTGGTHMRNRAGNERLGKIPLFENLSAKQLAAVDALVTTIDVASGRELIRQGEPGREFIVVVNGEAEVRRGGDVIATRGPGSFFGETALLLDQPRNASVVAKTDMTIEVIDRQDFKRLLDEYPDLHAPLLEAVAQRLAELDEST